MPLYRDQGIVLRTHKLGEADRIITVLTRSLGKVRTVGKGVRRTKSRFGARLEPGMLVDLQCYEGRTLDTVTQAETLESCPVGPSAPYAVRPARPRPRRRRSASSRRCSPGTGSSPTPRTPGTVGRAAG